MKQQRKRYSAQFKAKVALEAIKGHKAANEIASEDGVHPCCGYYVFSFVHAAPQQ